MNAHHQFLLFAKTMFRLYNATKHFSVFALLLGLWTGASPAHAYDPMSTSTPAATQIQDVNISSGSDRHPIPVRLYLPSTRTPMPVILFSHGLGGSRAGSRFLGEHWAAREYLAVFLQHPGSDESVWRDQAPARRMRALKQAANPHAFLARVEDVRLVLDTLEKWNRDPDHALYRKLDLHRIGMAGHSFGAVTTQAVSGQSLQQGGATLTDPRIRAAILMSPSTPARGTAAQAFGNVKVPWLLMTGTEDEARIGGQTIASRQAVFPALPPGGKYELVLDGAQHSIFTDHPLPGERGKRDPKHQQAILAMSTAFWDSWLRESPEARAWLDGDGARSVLSTGDRWQRK